VVVKYASELEVLLNPELLPNPELLLNPELVFHQGIQIVDLDMSVARAIATMLQ
jgi:hypothetical protein